MLYCLLLLLAKGPVGALAVRFGLSSFTSTVLSGLLAILGGPRMQAPAGPAAFYACWTPAGATDTVPMCLVPGGTVRICTGPNKDKCEDVELKPFLLDLTEVTVAAFSRCVDAGACPERHFGRVATSEFCNLGAPGREAHPANCVGYEGAKDYCKFARKRLPALAEWRRAALGFDGRKYPWGEEPVDCTRAVYHSEAGRGCGNMYTVPAGSLAAGRSAFGPFDLAGNVMEWTSTLVFSCAAKEGQPDPEEDEEAMRYTMGGSFADTPELLRSASSSVDEGESESVAMGIRCAADRP